MIKGVKTKWAITVSVALMVGLVFDEVRTKKRLNECRLELTETKDFLAVYKELLRTPARDANITAQKILKLQPGLDERVANWYALIINAESPVNLHDILISIIFAESSFDHLKRSRTGDYGLGQTNYRVWGQFFGVSRNDLLNPITSIKITATILQMAKTSHGTKSDWYAYYHSWNHIPRQAYRKRIDKILKKLGTCTDQKCELNYDRETLQK